jgi:putative DNA methylase
MATKRCELPDASVPKRKLIEVALPLEAINRESAREKSIRHGHPSTLHLWWARRPLAAARAVLFAQLVDDPSSLPNEFPTEEAQRAERERLHGIIQRLVVWENIRDERLFDEARAEIWKSCDGNPPPILDPFAGGGTIPLEAQRLGLEVHASDLNPVAVLINKALIEIPPKFRNQPPVFPGLSDSVLGSWRGVSGLAADVRAYGSWMREEAEKRIGILYPKAVLPNGNQVGVIAWIWARTVTCPNPACGMDLPLVKSWWLAKKRGKESYIVPTVVAASEHGARHRVEFDVAHDPAKGPPAESDGTVGRKGAFCIACSAAVPLAYVRSEGSGGRMGSRLMAVVAEGSRKRVYLPPSDAHVKAADVPAPNHAPAGDLGYYPRDIKAPIYGLTKFSDLFTNRQLTALTTFSDLVAEARAMVFEQALAAGRVTGERLEEGGTGAAAYADAVATYLGLTVSRCADYWSSICSWHNTGEKLRNVFGRQAIPMAWDYTETMPFSESTGGYSGQLSWVAKVLDLLPDSGRAVVEQADASGRTYAGMLLSTDPPYYDNIGYSDLSDFFYVWLRRSLRDEHPRLLSTMLVPKSEELVANPYRHGGADGAKNFFEQGFRTVFTAAREGTTRDHPTTVWYAFKQSDTSELGTASSGWETLLDGMINGGWTITATWPNRSELANRMMASGMNALASSIVLAIRPRSANAPTTDRRGFINALHAELPRALRRLQEGAIAPVDLPQAAIGPGMAVFSRYRTVIEGDGTKMTVRSALARINEILDEVLNEQEGDFDSTTRFGIAWYRQHGYGVGKFGDADNLARARNTSVGTMDRDQILSSRAGKVKLFAPGDLSWNYEVLKDDHTSAWEGLHHLIKVLERDGVASAGGFLRDATERADRAVDPDLVKELAFLLFSLAEKNGWTKDAMRFNTLATSWPDILDVARRTPARAGSEQGALDFSERDE